MIKNLLLLIIYINKYNFLMMYLINFNIQINQIKNKIE